MSHVSIMSKIKIITFSIISGAIPGVVDAQIGPSYVCGNIGQIS